jgi:hypothetical protein
MKFETHTIEIKQTPFTLMLHVCAECGAIVYAQQDHEAWHARNAGRARYYAGDPMNWEILQRTAWSTERRRGGDK